MYSYIDEIGITNDNTITYLEFDSGPRTLIGPGECTADLIFVNASSGLIDPHQIWA